jgi:hypothetical protein
MFATWWRGGMAAAKIIPAERERKVMREKKSDLCIALA